MTAASMVVAIVVAAAIDDLSDPRPQPGRAVTSKPHGRNTRKKENMIKQLDILLSTLICLSSSVSAFSQHEVELNNRAMELVRSAPGNRDSLKKAIGLLDSATTINPKYQLGYWNKSSILLSLGEFEASIECQDRILRLRPYRIEAWIVKGEVLERIGRADEAKLCYRRALSLEDSILRTGKAAPSNKIDRAYLMMFTETEESGLQELRRLIRRYPGVALYKQMEQFFVGFDRKKFISSLGKN